MMNIINKHLGNKLSGFKGLEVSGEIPFSDELINDFVQTLLFDTKISSNSPKDKPSQVNLNLSDLLEHVKSVKIQSQTGKVKVKFKVMVE